MPEGDINERLDAVEQKLIAGLENLQAAITEGFAKLETLLTETQTFLERIADAVEGWDRETPGT